MKRFHTLTLLLMVLFVSSNAYSAENVTAVYDDGYLVLGTDSGNFSLKLDGRIMIDTGAVSSDLNDFVERTHVRRARLAFKTTFAKKWAGEFDIDFADDEADIKDMWISYIGLDNFEFKVGNHKPFFSIGEMTTSRWATFMETSMITDATASGRRLGLSASYSHKSFFAGVSVFGDAIGVDNRDPEGDESEPGVNVKYNYSFRTLYRPFANSDVSRFFHVGLNYLNLRPQSDDDQRFRLRVGLESSVFDYNILSTGRVRDVAELESVGLEFAARFDKFSFQGEYLSNTLNRTEADKLEVESDGYYVQSTYMIIGSGRPYNLSDGEFGPVLPQNPWGNLEFAVRYSTIDLNDVEADVLGGESDNITFALNWYAHNNVVVRLNHTIASLGENADGNEDYIGGDDISITGLRLQLNF